MRLTEQEKKFIRCALLEYADENIEEIINDGYENEQEMKEAAPEAVCELLNSAGISAKVLWTELEEQKALLDCVTINRKSSPSALKRSSE